MNKLCLTCTAWFLMMMFLPLTYLISGKILDREGKPLVNGQITYTNMATGVVYKLMTDKKGEFSLPGVLAGNYHIEIKGPDGSRVYTGQRSVGQEVDDIFGTNTRPLATNVLNVDLSTAAANGELPTDMNAGKLSKADIAAARKANGGLAQVNRLIRELHPALEARDWPRATVILQELIAIVPNRWEFYQNLGTIQSSQAQYQEAATTFENGVPAARRAAGNTPSPEALDDIGKLLISQAEAYNRLGNLKEALARYGEAAKISPHPAMAHFYACNTQRDNGNVEPAIAECNLAITADPSHWEFYQTKAGAESILRRNEAAIQTYELGVRTAKAAVDESRQPIKAKAGMGQMLNSEGNLYVQLKDYEKAAVLFAQAAEVASYPALPLFNLCAMRYTLHQEDAAVVACDQTIASDPTMAEAYFVKATVLFHRSSVSEGRYQAPSGTREALTKYLELSPDGMHAAEAQAMLAKLGVKLDTTYQPKS